MYLKSIEVQGFKSFAHRMLFEFHNGITGIVGPNGSGKSNVVDAVRWVFGEQSAKQLRGGSMQDVIFAGTEMRKPLSYASVAITLDNSDHALNIDYEEVKVTRRLYRSGESEYLLNDAAVRLRDINELFYDTGIGKEGYSIISQNQIEKIFSGRPEDRRELFDEAAGIVKFKRRKNATVKKLDEEHQNLLRVNDILAELTSQLAPLEKQSETARIYLSRKEELKKLDINMFLIEMERIGGALGENEEKTAIAQKDLDESTAAFDEVKTEYEVLQQKLDELEVKVQEAHDRNAHAKLLKQQREGEIELIREQLRTQEVNRDHIANRRRTIEEEIAKRKAEIEGYAAEQAAFSDEIRKAEETIRTEEEKLASLDRGIEERAKSLASIQDQLIKLLNGRATVKGKGQRYDAMLEQIGIRNAEISARVLRLKEEETEARAILAERQAEDETLRASIEQLDKDLAANEVGLNFCQRGINESNKKLDEVQTAYHRDASKLESLKSLSETYDGYGNGIRRVMEQKSRVPGIIGVVAELLHVDKKYEVAIENALGNRERNIVTDDEQTAKKMIGFLKANKLGRATFLPLSSLRRGDRYEPASALSEPGVIGLGSSLVTTERGYEALADYLLGRILIVETIDDAIALGRKYHHRLHMVTLEGDLFTPGGAITGGSFRNPGTLLGRKREIEELEASVKALREQLAAVQKELDRQRDKRTELRNNAVRLHEQLQQEKIRQNTVQMERKQAEERLSLSRVESGASEKESAEIANQIAEVKNSSSEIENALRQSAADEAELNARAEALDRENAELSAKRDAQAQILEDLRLSTASIREKDRFWQENLHRLNRECEEFRTEDQTLQTLLAAGKQEEEGKYLQIRALEEKIKESEQAAESSAAEESALSEEKQKLTAEHRSFFEKRDALSNQVNLLDKELYRLNAERERLTEQEEQQTAYMWEEYELTPVQAKELRVEGLDDRRILKKEIAHLKTEIKGLGSVNVNAIEEYKTVKERHTFLSAQQEDLVKSEETLTKIIEELEEGMRKQFREQFADIRREFDKVVKEMFGGGMGSLELKDDTDILETDIAIIVQPPGKKLQNISLLSGGERTLTAIALLFAIQNLKPSPFALLDEIEAALDEQNIDRFARYLKKLSKKTQFIVITHRRGTMNAADRLYGITMQEKGISTLVSVSLIEGELDN